MDAGKDILGMTQASSSWPLHNLGRAYFSLRMGQPNPEKKNSNIVECLDIAAMLQEPKKEGQGQL